MNPQLHYYKLSLFLLIGIMSSTEPHFKTNILPLRFAGPAETGKFLRCGLNLALSYHCPSLKTNKIMEIRRM